MSWKHSLAFLSETPKTMGKTDGAGCILRANS